MADINNDSNVPRDIAVYRREDQPSAALAAIAEILTEGGLDRSTFDDIVSRYEVRRSDEFRDGLLDLVISVVRESLSDHRITSQERDSIQRLKTILRIEEGAFYKQRPSAIETILEAEMSRLLLDERVDRTEALHQVELQAIFDLSYDEYIELTQHSVARVVGRIVDRIPAPGVSASEHSKVIQRQLSALDTMYRLSPEQRQAIIGR